MNNIKPLIPGLAICILIGAAGFGIAQLIPLGAVTFAIIIGILVGNTLKPGERFKPGIAFSEKKLLACAIALMGIKLDFTIVKDLGFRSLALIVLGIGLTIGIALVFSRLLRFDRKFSLLLGIGNGICGSSAIAAAKPIIGADEEKAGLSVAIVNFLGTLGILLIPLLAKHLMTLSDLNIGLMIGNTLQAMGQVAAAGFAVSDSVGQTATLVKMTRILMLTPVLIILITAFSRKQEADESGKTKLKFKIPLFIIFFFVFSLIPTFGLLPESWIKVLGKASKYLLIIAMAGIGLKITFSSILKDGRKALLIGTLVWVVQILFSASVMYMFFRQDK